MGVKENIMCAVKEEKDKIVGVKEEKVASEMKGEEGDLIVSLKEVYAMKGKEGGQIVGMVEDVVEHLLGVVESQENYVEDVTEVGVVKGVEDHLMGVEENYVEDVTDVGLVKVWRTTSWVLWRVKRTTWE